MYMLILLTTGLIIGLVAYFTIEYNYALISVTIFNVFLIFFRIFHNNRLRKKHLETDWSRKNSMPDDYRKKNEISLRQVLFMILAIFLIFFAVPSLLVYWHFRPTEHKKAIQVFVLFLSAGFAIIYYCYNTESFPSAADKAGYFTGVILFPSAIVEIIL